MAYEVGIWNRRDFIIYSIINIYVLQREHVCVLIPFVHPWHLYTLCMRWCFRQLSNQS